MTRPTLSTDLETARDVARLACEVFGTEPRTLGVLHPAAAWREGERLRSLIIGPQTPKCSLDAFSLNLARARADAVVTTGRILRCEPTLTHDLQGPGGMSEALARWREDLLGEARPLVSLVLTSGQDLDLDHPLFRGSGRSVIFTAEEGRRRLAGAATERGIEVVASPEPGLRAAIRFLQRRGAKTISVEAGPGTSRELYLAPLMVDELFLSLYGAPTLPEVLRGGDLPPRQQLAAQFRGLAAFFQGEGDWSFYRYFR